MRVENVPHYNHVDNLAVRNLNAMKSVEFRDERGFLFGNILAQGINQQNKELNEYLVHIMNYLVKQLRLLRKKRFQDEFSIGRKTKETPALSFGNLEVLSL